MENRIAELRKAKGMTLKQLSTEVGLGDNTLSRYETGKRQPKLETWQKLAKYFDVSIGYLMGITDIDTSSEEKLFKSLSEDFDKKYSNIVKVNNDNEKVIFSSSVMLFLDLMKVPYKQLQNEKEIVRIFNEEGKKPSQKGIELLKNQQEETKNQREKYLGNWAELLSTMNDISDEYLPGETIMLESDIYKLKKLNNILERLNKK